MNKSITDALNEYEDDVDYLEVGRQQVGNTTGAKAVKNLVNFLYSGFEDAVIDSTKEYVNDAVASFDKYEDATRKMYSNVPIEYLDEYNLSKPELTEAQQQFVNEYNTARNDFGTKATRDPAMLAGTVASFFNPYVLAGVSAPYVVNDLINAFGESEEKGAKQAAAVAIPTAASATATAGADMAARSLPKFSRLIGHPFAGAVAGTVAALALNEDTLKWAMAHKTRAAYTFFGGDMFNYTGKNWKNLDFSGGGQAVVTDGFKPKNPPSGNGGGGGGSSFRGGFDTGLVFANKKAKTQTSKSITDALNDPEHGKVTPVKRKQKPDTLAEEAFPENTLEMRERQQQLAPSEEVKPYQRLPENTEQGAYGSLLTYGRSEYPHPVSVEQIWKTANEITPVRPHDVTDANMNGYYMAQGEGIRIRGFQSWSTICHEIGHHVSKVTNWGQETNSLGKLIKDELYNGATSIWRNDEYGNHLDPALRNRYIEEGRAAFMNEYLINPQLAETHFPLAFKELNTRLAEHPELQTKLNILGEQIRKWGNDSNWQRANSTISYADAQPKSTLGKIMDDINSGIIDELDPLRRVSEDFTNERGIKLNAEENPANAAQRAKEGTNASAQMLIDPEGISTENAIQAVADKYDVTLHPVTFKSVFEPLERLDRRWLRDHGFTEKQGFTEAISTYLTALHEREVITVKNNERIREAQTRIQQYEQRVTRLEERMQTIDQSTPEGQQHYQQLERQRTQLQNNIDADNSLIQLTQAGVHDYTTPTPRAELDRIISEAPPEFREVAARYQQFNENLLDIGVAQGLLEPTLVNNLKQEYPHYVPMKRSFLIEGETGGAGGGAHAYANIDGFFRRLSREGSDRPFKDPLAQTALNAYHLVSKIERNNVAKAVVNLSHREGGNNLLMPLHTEHAPSNVREIITVYENGRPQSYQCVAAGLYDALAVANRSVQPTMLNVIEQISQGTAQALRTTATSTPAFAIANLFKDVMNATCLNKDGRKFSMPVPIVDQLMLVWDGLAARKDAALMAEYKAQGVQYTTYIGSSKQANANIREWIDPATGVKGGWNNTKEVFNKLTGVINEGELLPRLALYKRAKDRGCSPFEAAMIASDGTTNFMRSGTLVKHVNRHIPFFNAVIQGNNKIWRALKDDPVGVGLTCFTYITLPSLLCWSRNHDKDWYRDMPLSKKNKYWYWDFSLAQDGSAVMALPKNEALGYLFGSCVERMLDVAVDGDEGALNQGVKETVSQLSPSGFPTILLPYIEWQSNYSFFRDRPIVDMRTSKKEDKDQYNAYTSELAKGIGQTFNVSPMKVDNTIYDVTASLGYGATWAIDAMVKDTTKPSKKVTEYTRFTYTPETGHSRTSDVFYDGLDKLEKKYNSGTKKNKSKELKGMLKAKEAISKERVKYNAILEYKTITDGDIKRQKLDVITKKINNIQRKANSKYLGYRYIQSPK